MLSGHAFPGAPQAPQAREPSVPIANSLNKPKTVEWLRERFVDAADTLRRLPKPKGIGGGGLQSPWPDTIREWLAYAGEETQVRRAAPSPEAITRLDEVLRMLHDLSPDQRMILWARAEGLTWRRIEYLDRQVRRRGRQDRQLRNIRDDGEARILAKLNGTPPRARIALGGAQRAQERGQRVWGYPGPGIERGHSAATGGGNAGKV
jgi:hypothetical protein